MCGVGTSTELYAHRQREGAGYHGDATVVDVASVGSTRVASAFSNRQSGHDDDGPDHGDGSRVAGESGNPSPLFSREPLASLYIWDTTRRSEWTISYVVIDRILAAILAHQYGGSLRQRQVSAILVNQNGANPNGANPMAERPIRANPIIRNGANGVSVLPCLYVRTKRAV